MSDTSPAAEQRPKLTPNELDILHRMRFIDKGEGCHAGVKAIGAEYFERPRRSLSQTRQIIGRLRRKGFLKFVGVHANRGTNIYLVEGKTYHDLKLIPAVDPIRTSHLVTRSKDSRYGAVFDTSSAQAVLNGTAKWGGASIEYRGIHVPSWIHRNFGEKVLRAAVDEYLQTYPNLKDNIRYSVDGVPVRSESKVLNGICTRISREQKAKEAKLAEERAVSLPKATREPVTAEDAAAQAALIAEALALSGPARSTAQVRRTVPAAAGGPVTVRELVTREVASRGLTNKPSTAKTYQHYQRELCGHFGELPAEQLSEALVVAYCEARKVKTATNRQPASILSIRREIEILRAALAKAYRSKEVPTDPMQWWPNIKVTGKRGTRYLRKEHFHLLRKELKPYQRRWLDWACLTGGDYGELLKVKRKDCDIEQALVHLSSDEEGGKTPFRSRVIRLHPLLKHHVGKLTNADDAILRPWRNRIRDLRDACRRAGLDYRVNLKDLRRTFATWLRQDGCPDHEIKAMLGHARGSTMLDKHYAVPDPARWAAYLDKLLR
jgi:integrase